MGKQKPVTEVRVGHIKAAIWRNEDEDGKPFFSVTFTRLYKRAGEWAFSESFGRDDLLLLAKVAGLAHTKVYELQAEAREQDRTAA